MLQVPKLWPVNSRAASDSRSLTGGNVGDLISKTPGALLLWVPAVMFGVLVGYGGATVIGKQLE